VKRKITIFVVTFTILSALLLVLLGAVFCRMTLHPFRRLGTPPPNATTVTVLASDGTSLSAWWLQASKPNGNCVAVLHGIGDSRVGAQGFAPMFLNEGYSVLLPDSRAHGASEGEFVTYGLLEKHDVIAWSTRMKSAGCRKLFGFGESLGASILIQAAGVRPVFSAIVAECPYADLREVAEYRVREMGHVPAIVAKVAVGSALAYAAWVDGLDLRHVSPLDSIAHASTPILLIHGLRDSRTPPYNSERLAHANPLDPLWLVPNALHTGASRAEPQEFQRRVLDWFAKH